MSEDNKRLKYQINALQAKLNFLEQKLERTIDRLETLEDASLDDRLTVAETTIADHETRITALEGA